MQYTFLPHTADIKFQAKGQTLEQAFINSALALTNIITKDKIKPKIKKTITIKGKDKENLLYNFLEEFLYLLDVGGFLLSKIKNLKISAEIKSKKPLRYQLKLRAELLGDNQENYETEAHVKAITYNDMFIKQQRINNQTIFTTQVVVDV